ncbi:hypothetical protein PENTCL1PPCAC_12083, partial [Pristionchus entomophagus]
MFRLFLVFNVELGEASEFSIDSLLLDFTQLRLFLLRFLSNGQQSIPLRHLYDLLLKLLLLLCFSFPTTLVFLIASCRSSVFFIGLGMHVNDLVVFGLSLLEHGHFCSESHPLGAVENIV